MLILILIRASDDNFVPTPDINVNHQRASIAPIGVQSSSILMSGSQFNYASHHMVRCIALSGVQ